MNELIHKITKYLPNERIQFRRHETTKDLQIYFKNRKILTTIEDSSWDEIKRQLDYVVQEKSDTCSICSETIQTRRTHCTKCACDWCLDCYIQIFRTNQGIIKCPFCRFTYGQTFPDYMIELGVQQILNS
jgi:hypothetical protein